MILPKSVTEQYPELLHYTTNDGLIGILASGCLWASHASHLNDAEELSHFFDARLYDIAQEVIAHLYGQVPDSPRKQEVLRKGGGLKTIVRTDALNVTRLLKSATIGFHDPYILSLSAPSDVRIARSGLLSQWRGYGVDGGYALVLDTKGLDELLQLEGQRHLYQFAQWGDVYYYGLNHLQQPSSEEIDEYEATVRKGVLAIVEGRHPETVPDLYNAITSLSCLYKHWGFAEEQEVRVIAIPTSTDITASSSAAGETKTPRQPKTFTRGNLSVPYIELLANLDPSESPTRLPIKRVIVGPHRDKQSRVERIQRLMAEYGYDVEVTHSEIPYLGR